MSASSAEQAILVLLAGVVKNIFTEELIGCSGLVVGAVTTDQFNSCISEICAAATNDDGTCGTGNNLGTIATTIEYYVGEYTS